MSQVESLKSALGELSTYRELERQAKTIHERHKSLQKQVEAARSPVAFSARLGVSCCHASPPPSRQRN